MLRQFHCHCTSGMVTLAWIKSCPMYGSSKCDPPVPGCPVCRYLDLCCAVWPVSVLSPELALLIGSVKYVNHQF